MGKRKKKVEAFQVAEEVKIYTADQAAVILGISVRRVRKICSEGRLGQRFGGKSFLITHDELEEFRKIPREPGNPNFRKDGATPAASSRSKRMMGNLAAGVKKAMDRKRDT